MLESFIHFLPSIREHSEANESLLILEYLRKLYVLFQKGREFDPFQFMRWSLNWAGHTPQEAELEWQEVEFLVEFQFRSDAGTLPP